MRRLTLISLLAALAAAQAVAADFSFRGVFASDNDKREFFFTLAQPAQVKLRTWSYAGGTNAAGTVIPGGGFDPTLSLFDSSGGTIVFNKDGGCGQVAADSSTNSCWDAYISVQLPAGTYRAVLTQSDNIPNGPSILDSFYYNGQANFTQPPGNAAAGFWDFFPSQRNGNYAVDVLGVTAALAPSITSSGTLPPGITGSGYTPVTLTAQGNSVYTWSIVSGSGTTGLPGGMALSASGVVSGTPAAHGVYSFIAQADDGIQPVQQTVTLTVYDPVHITTTTLPAGQKGVAYSPFPLAATGGSGTFSWSSPNLPSGLGVSSSGQVSGTPAVVGNFSNLTVNLVDSLAGQSASGAVSIFIGYPPLLISGSTSLPETALGGSVSVGYLANGGNPPYTWSSLGLPAGLTLNPSTGALTGSPQQPGNYAFTIQVTDSSSTQVSLSATLSVLGITTTSLPSSNTTSHYQSAVNVAGGRAPYAFSATGLPAGLGMSSAGVITGVALAAGSFSVAVQVVDANGVTAFATLALSITAPPQLTVLSGALSSGVVGTPYSDSLHAAGGAGGSHYSWLIIGGNLPDGISLSSAGGLSGTPLTAATYSFTAQVSDGATTASGGFTITIGAKPLTLSSGSLPNGVVGQDYPLQILPATGGTPPYAFTLTGGNLPPGLSLSNGQISGIPTSDSVSAASFTITASDSSVPTKTATGAFSILIKPAQADLIISTTSLPFSLMSGATGLPTPENVTVRSSVILQLLNYAVAVTPAVPWLDVTGGTTTPGSITVALNQNALAVKAATTPYQTSITVSCVAPSPCAGSTQTIAVSLNVTAPPAQLSLTDSLLAFSSSPSSPVPLPQSLGVQNSGGGSLTIQSTTAGAAWISVSGVPSSLPAGPAVRATVSVDPTGLTPGFYKSSITITSSAGTASVPVTLLVAPNVTLTLGPSGQQFSAPAGSSPGQSSGSFAVSVAGNTSVNWSASVLPGSNWLSSNSAGGTASAAVPGNVSFSLDPTAIAQLTPQTYYGVIRVTSGDVVNSPQDFQVVLNIQQRATPVTPSPVPAGIQTSFVSGSGATGTASVTVFASSNTPLPYQASASTTDGGNWLTVSPSTGTTSTSAPGQSTLTFNPASLPVGVYRGGVSYAFSSAAVRTVNVTMVIAAGVNGQATPQILLTEAAGACSPSKLVLTQTGLVSNFAQPTAWPTPLTIHLVDDCGGAVPKGQVVATFSNGDPPLALTPIDSVSGDYSATWTPRSTSGQVTILARGAAAGFPAATTQITGSVTANAAPLLAPNGTLHAFAPLVGGSLGPGNIVQIYGSNLAAQPIVSSVLPLNTNLGGTTVLIGGVAAPLYYVSPGQINAQIPFELTPGKKYQVVVSANGALSTPDTLQLTTVSPGVAAFANGLIIAQHLDGSLVSETLPAKPGEYIIFYLAGLGPTDTPVSSGAASPSSPLARPTDPPVLTLNGVVQPYQFVGLTPGIVSLYQINFLVPAGTPDGDLPMVITQSGIASNQVVLPVKN